MKEEGRKKQDPGRGAQSAYGATAWRPAEVTVRPTAKASLWGLPERRPRLGVATHSFSSAQRSAWGRGRRGNSCQGSGEPGPARPAHREGVVYVEGNLPSLEGELLLPVPAHCHQSRHRPRRCRCHRHHLLPAAAAAAAAPAAAAAASSLLLPATAKPRERKHPPPRSTFATGGREKSRRGQESWAAFPITRFHTRSANQRGAALGPAPSRRCPSPPPTPPASSLGPKERRKGPAGPGASPDRQRSPGSRTQLPTSGPMPAARCPPPTVREPSADPFSPFKGAPRPVSPLGCSCPARPRPWEGSTPPQLCGVRGGSLRPFPHTSWRWSHGSDLHRFRGRLPDPHLGSPLPADEARVRAGLGGSAAPNAVSSPGSVSRSRHG